MYYVDSFIKNTFRVPQPEGRRPYIRLDQNENPDGLPKWFFDKVMKEITPSYLATYPEEGVLTEKFAKKVGVNTNQVTLTDGSVVGMGYAIKVFGNPQKNLVCVTPSFGMYKAYADMIGMKSILVPYEKDFTFDCKKILSSIDENTSIVVLVNPNMPVGNVYSYDEIESVIKKAKENNAVVIIDEAYYYFYDKTSISFINKYDNVMILRTFSKMLSIPGLRLGVVISNPTIIQYLNNYKPHYTVNTVALLFGERIIDNYEKLLPELSKTYEEGHDYIISELAKRKYETLKSYGCFVCIKAKHKDVSFIVEELKKKGILVLKGVGPLSSYVRLTICGKKYMEAFISALDEIDK